MELVCNEKLVKRGSQLEAENNSLRIAFCASQALFRYLVPGGFITRILRAIRGVI